MSKMNKLTVKTIRELKMQLEAVSIHGDKELTDYIIRAICKPGSLFPFRRAKDVASKLGTRG